MTTTPNDLTRQQLDELDTLLQRMLALPLSKSQPATPVTLDTLMPEGWRADPPTSTPSPHVNPIPLPVELEPSPVLAGPVPVPVPIETAVELSLAVQAAPATEPMKPSLSPLLWPLFGMNYLIEGCLKLFGPPGEMLTRPASKGMLGASGLAMLVAAGLWVAQGEGWIRLPIDEILGR